MAILVGQLSAVMRVNKRSSQENDTEKNLGRHVGTFGKLYMSLKLCALLVN